MWRLNIGIFCCVLSTVHGLTPGSEPSLAGREFVQLKEVPPVQLLTRSSGSVTLTCSAAGSPAPAVAWFKDGVELSVTKGIHNGLGETYSELHLPCVDPKDEGTYECVGESGERQVSATTMVEVIGPSSSGCKKSRHSSSVPRITGWYSSIMLESGNTVRLVCSVNASAGKVMVIWRDGMGKQIEESESFHFKGTDLVISDVNWSHMGRYTCTVQNGLGLDATSTFLYPLAPANLV